MSEGKFSLARRASGLLLHPTSLPSRHGVGDLGGEAHRFADFLAAAGQRWWQMLPITPPGQAPGYSPYSSYSVSAGSPWMISLDRLVDDGLLSRADVEPVGGLNGARVDYGKAIAYREPRLRKAFETFVGRAGEDGEFGEFCVENAPWLDDYALFVTLKTVFRGKSWDRWEKGLRLRQAGAVREARRAYAPEITYHQFVQWQFDRQWRALRAHCASRDVGLIGDIPIFVAYDSVDVWANRQLFQLDRDGRPVAVTGVPPDLFSADGQLWNHPQYKWAAHRKEGYGWWVRRFEAMARHFDAVRIDHFLGFQRAWAIPAGAKNAKKGRWQLGPQDEIFKVVKKRMGEYPIIAEDLGVLTPEAAALRDRQGFPGMRVLQFGFGGGDWGGEMYLPHGYVKRCVAYTGTHDNPTAVGWYRALPKGERAKVLEYLGAEPGVVHRDMIRAVMTSVADTAIFPVQDLLGLDDRARMNRPGVDRGNWRWRLKAGELNAAMAGRLRRLTEISGRA